MASKATYRQILSSSMVLLASFVYGCKVGYTQTLTKILSSPNPPFLATSEDISWITSVSYTGTLISIVFCYALGDKVSRRVLLSGCALTFAISWLLILVTSSALVIIGCFFFYGIAASMLLIIGNNYFGEIASPGNRELLTILYSLAIAIGSMLEFPISIWRDYRLLALFPLLVSVVTVCAVIFMVESPYYLVARGRDQLAVRNLCWLNDKADVDDVAAELNDVRRYIAEQQCSHDAGSLRIILQSSNVKLVLVMIFINFASLVECSTITSSYGPVLVDRFPAINGVLFVQTFHACGIASTLLSLYTIKRFSRRLLLLAGFLAIGLIQVSLAVCYYVEERNANHLRVLSFFIVALLLLLPLSSAATVYAAVCVLKVEVFPHTFKEFYASLLAFTSDWVAFAVIKSYPQLSASIGIHSLLVMYAAVSFAGATIVYCYIRETKGKTLYQIRTDYAAIDR